MASDFGSKGGSDDEKQHTAHTKGTSDGDPGIGVLALHGEFLFDLGEALFALLAKVEPVSLGFGGSRSQADQEDEFDDESVFHGWVNEWGRGSKEKSQPPQGMTGSQGLFGVGQFQRRHSLKNSQLWHCIPGEGMKS